MAACHQVFHPAAGLPGKMVTPRTSALAAAAAPAGPAGGTGERFREAAGRHSGPLAAVRRPALPQPTPVPDRMVTR